MISHCENKQWWEEWSDLQWGFLSIIPAQQTPPWRTTPAHLIFAHRVKWTNILNRKTHLMKRTHHHIVENSSKSWIKTICSAVLTQQTNKPLRFGHFSHCDQAASKKNTPKGRSLMAKGSNRIDLIAWYRIICTYIVHTNIYVHIIRYTYTCLYIRTNTIYDNVDLYVLKRFDLHMNVFNTSMNTTVDGWNPAPADM